MSFFLLCFGAYVVYSITVTIVFEEIRDCSTSTSIQLSEIEFLSSSETRISIGSLSNPGGRSPGRETPSKVYDGDVTSKWLEFNIIGDSGNCLSSTLEFTDLDSYPFSLLLTTANDSPERDPTTFSVTVCDATCTSFSFSVSPPNARFTLYDIFSLVHDPTRLPSRQPSVSFPTDAPSTSRPSFRPTSSRPTTSSPTTSDPSSSPLTSSPTISPLTVQCFDTLSWENNFSMNCQNYETTGWCNGVEVESWIGGVRFNYPERNCCACGKQAYDEAKAEFDTQLLQDTYAGTEQCEQNLLSNDIMIAKKLTVMQQQMRILEEKMTTNCKSEASKELDARLEHRMDEVKAYLNRAIASLLESLGLTTTSEPDVWFNYVNGFDQECVVQGSSDLIPLAEDDLDLCITFCTYTENCLALSYTNQECMLLHSLPSQTTPNTGSACMYKIQSSDDNAQFANTTDMVCSCGPTNVPTTLPSSSPENSNPTTSPTRIPSNIPTTPDPTEGPTKNPTIFPSDVTKRSFSLSQPSQSPSSSQPSAIPSSSPTTVEPTALPSTVPTTPIPTNSPTTPPPIRNLQKFNISFALDSTADLCLDQPTGPTCANVGSLETFMLEVMDRMMEVDNHAALYIYSCCDHQLEYNAFSLAEYTGSEPKAYYTSLLPTKLTEAANHETWLNSVTVDDNPNLQFVMYDFNDRWLAEPGVASENFILVILHSLALATSWVYDLESEGVPLVVVAVGTEDQRTTWQSHHSSWTNNGEYFYGVSSYSDLNANEFLSWLRSTGFP